MRLLIVIDRLEFGGVPVSVLNLVKGLRAHGCRVVLGVMKRQVDYPLPDGLNVEWMGMDRYSWRRWCWPVPHPSAAAWFLAMERKYGRFDGIVLTWWNAMTLAEDFPAERTWLWAHLDMGYWLGRPSVAAWNLCGRRTPWIARKASKARILPLRPQLFEGRRMLFVSEGIRKAFRQDFGDILADEGVLHNPLDIESLARKAEAPLEDGLRRLPSPDACYSGRLVPGKQVDHLLAAFHQSGIPGDLCLIGDGPTRKSLERQAKRLGIGGRVHITGFLANPFPMIRRCGMNVLCSNRESWSMSLAEALALGVPCVSYDMPYGPSELLAGPLSAGLIPPQDVAALASKMRAFHDAPVRPAPGAVGRFAAPEVAAGLMARFTQGGRAHV